MRAAQEVARGLRRAAPTRSRLELALHRLDPLLALTGAARMAVEVGPTGPGTIVAAEV
ncbi:hypothetical protein GCM10018781_60370 [Kitasatospora indigofera]|uniref:Uncharacterized protein n=1 Tax=Kitasatospora indigofera TaxID=67307 RepID=A0A919G8W9_9ACTN|nr:hypothetical protein GCM10018781_60370 [Kitasatospora indigofera]